MQKYIILLLGLISVIFLVSCSSIDSNRKIIKQTNNLKQSVFSISVHLKNSHETKIVPVATAFTVMYKGETYCVTARHVFKKTLESITDFKKRGFTAKILAYNSTGFYSEIKAFRMSKDYDICIFKLKNPNITIPHEIDPAPKLQMGQSILSLGYPVIDLIKAPTKLGDDFSPTLATGLITRITSIHGQHNMPTIGGFSGSPVLGTHNKIIGIINESSHVFFANGTRTLNAANINFFIKSNYICKCIDNLNPN